MAFGVKLEVWGDYASFNRPEMKVERVSYEVITPSAAKGILEAIYWKPQMEWVINSIKVLSPIRFTHVRRNEINTKIPIRGKAGVNKAMRDQRGNLGISVEEHRQQRAAMILRNVRYGIEAFIRVLDPKSPSGETLEHPEAKHIASFKRRASKGQYFHHPYLGCREFPACFRLLRDEEKFPSCPDELSGQHDLGIILWGMVFNEDPKGSIVESNRGNRLTAHPRFFRAKMNDGVIDIPTPEEISGGS
jgi:CRISPR-associated protein Cas5d